MAVSTVIIKPTKFCNAECTYCSAPPEVNGAPKWSHDDFRAYFDKLYPYLMPNALLLWHGGEPMLMGPDFYWKAWDYVQKVKPGIRFSMQSNILGYDRKRWKDLLAGPFEGSISTSFDPDEQHREVKGSTSLYTRIFNSRLDAMLEDGFHPKVIGTYTDDTIHLAMTMYDRALARGRDGFDIRINYRYPAGRDKGNGAMITPENYGRVLIELYNRWIKELPDFVITPLDEMLAKQLALTVQDVLGRGIAAVIFSDLSRMATSITVPSLRTRMTKNFALAIWVSKRFLSFSCRGRLTLRDAAVITFLSIANPVVILTSVKAVACATLSCSTEG